MTLRLYLDDCANDGHLRALLQAAGHTVIIPAEAGTIGRNDDIHLRYAIEHDLVLVTMNARDFLALHQANSQHPGIVLIYRDNDVVRDMTNQDIVQALALLEQAYQGVGLANLVHVLNPWRTAPSAADPPPSTPRKGKKGRPRK